MLTRRKISLFRFDQRPPLDASSSLMAPRKRAIGRRCERLNLSPAGVHRPGIELTAADAAVAAANERGMHLIGLLGGAPCRFDSDVLPPHPPGHVFTPAEPTAYARYVEHIAERYRDTVQWWESWHEPNLAASWGASPDAAAYAELLRAQYRTIKRVSPDAKLALAAMARTDLAFLRGVLDRLGGERCFDAVAVHPYRWHGATEEAVRDVRLEDGVTTAPMTWKQELRSVATMVDRLGYGATDLWITEVDWGVDHDPELMADSMLSVGVASHGEQLTRDARHIEDSFASLRDDPDLDFVKTGLWFDLNDSRPLPPLAAEPAAAPPDLAPPPLRLGSGLVSAGN